MATYTTYQNTLPDPYNQFSEAGGGTYNTVLGAGYASVKLSSEQKIMNTRTNSGRLISRSVSGHKWNIDISYNPMTREEFEPVYSFIAQQKTAMTPFFVSLPQYRVPRDPTFAAYVASDTTNLQAAREYVVDVAVPKFAGATSIMVVDKYTTTNANEYHWFTRGSAKPGDLFTITDPGDSNHSKVYQVTRVETNNIYLSGAAVAEDEQRVHFTPPLQRSITHGVSRYINFHNPKFRVILASDIVEYSLNTNNLYSFSLKLEEALI